MQRFIPLHLFFILCFCSPLAAEISLTGTIEAETFIIQSSKKFYIHGDEGIIGIVHRKSHAKSYELVDSDKNLYSVAALDKTYTELGSKFDIFDANGAYLGSIIESPFSFLPEFHILSPSGKTLAIANANFLHTEYTLLNPETGDIFATLYRPAIRDGNDWSAHILNPEAFELDPCVFISFLTIRSDN
jgi:hypothetical protein